MATYRYHRTFTPSPNPDVLAYFRKRLDDFLAILEQQPAAIRVSPSATGRRWPTFR